MTILQAKAAVRSGALVMGEVGKVEAKSDFQRRRLQYAVTTACLYLKGAGDSNEIATTLGVTQERAAQIIRLGIKRLMDAGWLTAAAPNAPTRQP